MYNFNDYIHHGKRMVLFTYATKSLSAKDKVRFYYALKGRDGKTGIVKGLRLDHVGKCVLLVPSKHDEEIQEFFQLWNIPATRRKIIVDDKISTAGQFT
jgi:hypothetical protein